MAELTLYSVKQDRLTTDEIDNNFTALNDQLNAASADLLAADSFPVPDSIVRRDESGIAIFTGISATNATIESATIINLNVSGTQSVSNLSATGSVSAQDGTFSGVVSAAAVTGIGQGFSEMAVETTSGTFNVPANVTRLKFTIIGAGAGGGGTAATANTAGGGGGAGGFLQHIVSVTPGDSITYVVGTGGVGNSGAAGTAGADTTLTIGMTTYTAAGGGAGTTSAGGAGGATSGLALVTITGQNGAGGSIAAMSGGAMVQGGSVFMGYGIGGLPNDDADGQVGIGYGAGGSGAVTTAATARAGGAGKNGVVIFEY